MDERLGIVKMAKEQKRINALEKELQAAKDKIKQQKAYNDYMQGKYKDLLIAQENTNILPAAVMAQLAIINLNVGEWKRQGPHFVLHIPAITVKTPIQHVTGETFVIK